MKIKSLRTNIGALVVAVLMSSCGGGGGTPLTQSAFCQQKAERECAGVANKCLATTAACEAVRMTACTAFAAAQQRMPSALARPFRPDKTSDCWNKTSAAYVNTTITPADLAPVIVACSRVFSGTKKSTDTDKSCTNDYECDASQICDVGFGQCAPKKSVGANAGCNNPGEVCPTDQYCTGTPRMCTPKAAMGETCDATTPCVEALRCTAGACAARVDLGGTCDPAGDDCSTAAPYCDSYNGNICTPGFTPATGSQECIQAFGGTVPGGGGGDASAD